jgi:pimeloyl-ACP methyl ester carboxylesterase
LFAAANPDRVRRVCVLNAPLGNGHKLPDPLAVYGRPFGMGKGANADVYKLAYFGNEFAIDPERMGVYEAPYVGPDAAAARDAFEATATATSLKDATSAVTAALSKGGRGAQKVRVVWGSADKYLGDAPMYKWCEDVRASFDVMRKVGHMPQEDFAEETAKFASAFFQSEGRVGALGSVRLGKIGKDDDYDRS